MLWAHFMKQKRALKCTFCISFRFKCTTEAYMRVKIASYFKIQLLLQHLNSTAINTDIFIEDLHGGTCD